MASSTRRPSGPERFAMRRPLDSVTLGLVYSLATTSRRVGNVIRIARDLAWVDAEARGEHVVDDEEWTPAAGSVLTNGRHVLVELGRLACARHLANSRHRVRP